MGRVWHRTDSGFGVAVRAARQGVVGVSVRLAEPGAVRHLRSPPRRWWVGIGPGSGAEPAGTTRCPTRAPLESMTRTPPNRRKAPVSAATPAPTPSWSSTSARSTPSSSPAASARPGSTARSCRAPCRSRRCSPRTRRRSSSPAAPRRCTRRAPPPGPRPLRGLSVPVFGMCYGFQLMATTLGGTVDNTGAREYGRTELHVSRRPPPSSKAPRSSSRCGCRTATPAPPPRGLHGHRVHGRRPGRRLRERREEALRRPAPPRGDALHARPAGARALPVPRRGPHPGLDHRQRHRRAGRPDPRAGRRQARHLRSVRRCRLRGGGGPGPEGHRLPADLRLRRPRPDAQG